MTCTENVNINFQSKFHVPTVICFRVHRNKKIVTWEIEWISNVVSNIVYWVDIDNNKLRVGYQPTISVDLWWEKCGLRITWEWETTIPIIISDNLKGG